MTARRLSARAYVKITDAGRRIEIINEFEFFIVGHGRLPFLLAWRAVAAHLIKSILSVFFEPSSPTALRPSGPQNVTTVNLAERRPRQAVATTMTALGQDCGVA